MYLYCLEKKQIFTQTAYTDHTLQTDKMIPELLTFYVNQLECCLYLSITIYQPIVVQIAYTNLPFKTHYMKHILLFSF